MASLSVAQLAWPNIANFEKLCGEVSLYHQMQMVASPVIPEELHELLAQLEAAGNSPKDERIHALIASLKKRAQDIVACQHANHASGEFSSERSPQGLEIELTDGERDQIRAIFRPQLTGFHHRDFPIYRVAAAAQKAVTSLYLNSIDCLMMQNIQICTEEKNPPKFSWQNGSEKCTFEQMSIHNGAAVVHLPIGNAQGGIFSWAALAHAVAGHCLLAKAEIIAQIKENVLHALQANQYSEILVDYWTRKVVNENADCLGTRIDEVSADIVGVLNLGPASALGLIGYLKGIYKNAFCSSGNRTDPSPARILRAIAIAEAVSQLALSNCSEWGKQVEQLVCNSCIAAHSSAGATPQPSRDQSIVLDDKPVDVGTASSSAKVVAHAILNDPVPCLGGKSLKQIRSWTGEDQRITDQIASHLLGAEEDKILPKDAKHILAAATLAALRTDSNTTTIFSNMIVLLENL